MFVAKTIKNTNTHTRRQFEGFEDVKHGGTKSIG